MVTQTVENKGKESKQLSKDQGKQQASVTPFRASAFAPFGGFDPIFRFRDEFNRLFNQFAPGWDVARRDNWGLDVQEDDKTMTIHAEAPGFEPDEFDVEVRDNQLIMCACHKAENEEKESGTHEWQRREFYHSMMLPSGVDAEKVDAEYHHGILSVKLPKTGEANSRHIQVKG